MSKRIICLIWVAFLLGGAIGEKWGNLAKKALRAGGLRALRVRSDRFRRFNRSVSVQNLILGRI
jgi:hypothetical protein